jgi:hypothetical protein
MSLRPYNTSKKGPHRYGYCSGLPSCTADGRDMSGALYLAVFRVSSWVMHVMTQWDVYTVGGLFFKPVAKNLQRMSKKNCTGNHCWENIVPMLKRYTV